jgi:hypothetical protein
LEKLREIVRTATPPLTNSEVDTLLAKVISAEGRTVDEVLTSVREGIAALRKPSPPQAAGSEAVKVDEAAKEEGGGKEPGFATPGTIPAPIEKPKDKKPKATKEDKELGEIYSGILAQGRFNFLKNGEAVVLKDPGLVLVVGKPFSGYIAGRGVDGMLFIGSVRVTPKQKKSNEVWIVTIHGGSKVYGADGSVYSTSVTADIEVAPLGK